MSEQCIEFTYNIFATFSLEKKQLYGEEWWGTVEENLQRARQDSTGNVPYLVFPFRMPAPTTGIFAYNSVYNSWIYI